MTTIITTTITTRLPVRVPRATREPRGAQWVGRLADAALTLGRALRAERVRRRRAVQAEELRSHAQSFEVSSPGLAADLYAAADRHGA